MRVEGRSSGLRPGFVVRQELPQLEALGGEPLIGLVEHLRHGSPPRPSGEQHLLLGSCPAFLVSAPSEDLERNEVRSELRDGPWWRKVVLPPGAERRRAAGWLRIRRIRWPLGVRRG